MPNTSSGTNAAVLTGDLRFSDGGLRTSDLIGALLFELDVTDGVVTISGQNPDGSNFSESFNLSEWSLFRGNWDQSTEYTQSQIVEYDGSLWMNTAASTRIVVPDFTLGNPWINLTAGARFRGQAPATSVHYRSGDFILVGTELYLCYVAADGSASSIGTNNTHFLRLTIDSSLVSSVLGQLRDHESADNPHNINEYTDAKVDGRMWNQARAGNNSTWPESKLDLSRLNALIDHLSDVIAHGPHVGDVTTVDATRHSNVLVFTIPDSILNVPASYDIKFTINYNVNVSPLVYELTHNIIFTVSGGGALATELPAHDYTGGRAPRATYHITIRGVEIGSDAATIRIAGEVAGYITDDVRYDDGSHATFTVVSEGGGGGLTAAERARLLPPAAAADEGQGVFVNASGAWVKSEVIDSRARSTAQAAQTNANTAATSAASALQAAVRAQTTANAALPASELENYAKVGTTAKVPFTRLPDVVIFKSRSGQPTDADRVAGEHVLFWNTQTDYIFVHDGNGANPWRPLTFGSSQFLAGPGAPSNALGTPNSVYMEVNRETDGTVSSWYIWSKNASNEWVNRFQVPIQSDATIKELVREVVPAQDSDGAIEVRHNSGLVEVFALLTGGAYVVLADSNGRLPDPNFTVWFRKTPAYHHGVWYEPRRRYVGVTDGTLAEVAQGTVSGLGSLVRQYRGGHHGDHYVTNPAHRDVYFTLVGSEWDYTAWRYYTDTGHWNTTVEPFGSYSNGRNRYRGIAVDDNSALHDAHTVGDFYLVGSGSNLVLKRITALPSTGTAQYYWEATSSGTLENFKYVTALPDPGSVATSDYRKIWVVAANATSVPTEIAHLAAQDAHIWHIVVGEDPSNSDRYGWVHNEYGRADQNKNVNGLYERPSGSNYITVMTVNTNDAGNPVNVSNQRHEVFIRKVGETEWQRRHVSNGLDGEYEGSAHSDHDFELGHEYEIVVRNAATEIHGDAKVTTLPGGLYTFYSNAVKFVSIPDLDSLDRARFQVQEIINRTPALPGEISETDIEDDDGTNTGLISGRRFEAAFANKFQEVADEAAATSSSSAGDSTIYWWAIT